MHKKRLTSGVLLTPLEKRYQYKYWQGTFVGAVVSFRVRYDIAQIIKKSLLPLLLIVSEDNDLLQQVHILVFKKKKVEDRGTG